MKRIESPFKSQILIMLVLGIALEAFSQNFTEIDAGIDSFVNGSVAWGDYNNDGLLDLIITGYSDFRKTILYQNEGNNSFVERTDITFPGISCSSAEWGDYNNDGLLDLILSGDYITKVYRNDGNNIFTDIKASLIGVTWSSTLWSDVNNDGYLDIIIAGQTIQQDNICKVYINQKNNFFTESDDFINGIGMGSIDQWDANKDSYVDLLLCGRDYSGNPYLGIYLNDGNGLFFDSKIELEGIADGSAKWIDYNLDGNPDIFATGVSDDKYVSILYKNTGNLLFEKVGIDFPIGERSLFDFGDFDGDGDKDVIFSGYSHENLMPYVNLYQNDIEDFSLFSSSFIQVRSGTLSWCPINEDQNLDLFVTGEIGGNHDIGTISRLYFNNDVQTNHPPTTPYNLSKIIRGNQVKLFWSKSTDIESYKEGITYNIRIGTESGGNDILPPNYIDSIDKRTISGYGNVFSDTTWIIKDLNPGKYYWSVQAIDQSGIHSKFSNEDTFQVYNSFTEGSYDLAYVSRGNVNYIDIDNDNDLDISIAGVSHDPLIVSDTIIKIFKNDNGLFSEIEFQNNNKFGTNIIWDDFNNDGFLDFIACKLTNNYDNLICLYLNDQYSNFISQGILPINESGNIIAFDYDKDGDIDLIASQNIYLNDSEGNFIKVPYSLPGIPLSSFNYNFDFNEKFVLNIDSQIVIYDLSKNSITSTLIDDAKLYSVAVGSNDFDNDGDIDLLLAGYDNSFKTFTRIFENRHKEFIYREDFNIRGFSGGDLSWFDYNNDGLTDFIISGYSGTHKSKIFKNDGNSFEELEQPLRGFQTIDNGDFDNDGDLDLLAGGYFNGLIETLVIINNNNWPNDPPTAPTNLRTKRNGYGIIFGWDAATDPQSTDGGLSYNLRVGSIPGGVDVVSPMSNVVTGYRRIPKMGNCQMNLGWRLDTLPEGTYYWSVQAIDQSFMGGAWAEEQTFTISVVRADFGTDTVCLGGETTFTDLTLTSGDPITEWKWDFGDGNTSVLQNPTHTYSLADTFNVQLIAISSQYSDTITKQVIVKPKPIAGFSADIVCLGSETNIINSTDYNSLSINDWKWDFGDGNTSAIENPGSHGYLNPGDYIVELIAIAENGCSDTAKLKVTVAQYPDNSISVNGPISFCEGESVTLSANYNDNYSYAWQLDENNLTGKDSSSFVAKTSGSYRVKITNSLASCVSYSPEINITILPSPPALPIAVDNQSTKKGSLNFDNLCVGDSVQLNLTDNPDLTYSWKLNGSPIGVEENYLVAKTPGTYTAQIINEHGCSCETSNSISISFNPSPNKPSLSNTGDLVLCSGSDQYLSITNYNENYQYTWLVGGNTTTGQSNRVLLEESAIYQAIATNEYGCNSRSEITSVTVIGDLIRPEIEFLAGREQVCPEEEVIIRVKDPLENLNYQWQKTGFPIAGQTDTQFSVSSEGFYSVSVSAQGCESESDPVEIVYKPALPKPEIFAEGTEVWYLASSNDSAAHYRWYYDNLLVQESDEHIYVAGQVLGKYHVKISDDDVCYTTSDVISIPENQILGIRNTDPWSNLRIYPNPTPGMFTLEMDNPIMGELIIDIFGETGARVINIKFQKAMRHFKTQIDLSEQPAAIYLIGLELDKHRTIRPLIVE